MSNATMCSFVDAVPSTATSIWSRERLEIVPSGPSLLVSREVALRVQSALRAFDRARDRATRDEARARLCELGPEALPAVLDELRRPQPPERLDALSEMLATHQPIATTLESIARQPSDPVHRSALIGALRLYAWLDGSGVKQRQGAIAKALAAASTDPDASVRFAVAEIIGLLEIRDGVAAQLLEDLAQDRNQSVCDEADAVRRELA